MQTLHQPFVRRTKGGNTNRKFRVFRPWNVRRFLLGGLSALILLAGCAAPKEATTAEEEDFFAMIPAVELSDDVVYSPEGDMKARLPERWVTLDDTRFGNPDIFAVACDPDYRMVIVFSEIPLDGALGDIFRSKGMLGLLQENYNERLKQMNMEATQLIGAEEFALGRRKFGAYSFTADSGATMTRVALFYTPKRLYECTISSLPYTENDLPPNETIKEIHQIVLGGIEW